MSELGAFLRKLRGKMTFREAAERSGLSHAYIRYLEIGKRPGTNTPINPSPEMLKGLAKAYNHSYKDLMVRAGYSYDEKEDPSIEETDMERMKREIAEITYKAKNEDDVRSILRIVEKALKE